MTPEQSKVYLETERLALRELSLKDEQLIFELDSDPEVMKYLTEGKPSSVEEVRLALSKTEQLLAKHRGMFGFWAAELRQSFEFIGWFHFRPAKEAPENLKRIELGYRLRRPYWGRGYATEGSTALLEKGFNSLGVDEIFAVTMEKT